jgi:alcohol dehydrogenase (cytochrome c)
VRSYKSCIGLLALSLYAQGDRGSWTTYGQNYAGWRYSELDRIDTRNVADLRPEWIFQSGVGGKFEATPLVANGLMYVTGASDHAWALDPLTGRSIWHYLHPVPRGLNICCGQVNRGFGMLGNRLFKLNLDATLVALDARGGNVLWETAVDDFRKGYSGTAAPLVAKNKVIVGLAGAEFGTRGFIDAYDADTGKRAWRFWTVAGKDDPGGKTWAGDSWRHGGGSTWITGTYDPELNLTYWGAGNPGPDLNGDERAGDNLYTCSLVALDADTGRLKWHYQFTPHDVHDWDAVSDPVLVNLAIGGRNVKAVLHANRNGYFYALDRTNGKLLLAKPYTQVTWANGIGADGRPILLAGNDPSEEGTRACPGMGGGHNWQATAYSPQTGLYYFSSTDGCAVYYKTKQDYIEGQWYQASTASAPPREPPTGSILAVDPVTGERRWRFELVSSPSAGILATGGGLVFTGDPQGYVFALDARTGRPLWKFQAGGNVIAPPISYERSGKQYIVVAAGGSLLAFAVR